MDATSELHYLEAAVAVVALLVIGYVIARSAGRALFQRGATPALVRGVRILLSIVFGLAALVVLSTSIGPFNLVSGLTFSAFAGLAATLALQTTLQNIIAGFILFRNRLLRLNDTIEISGMKGRVVQVGIVTTWLRLDDGTVASVSNNTLLSGPMRNHSAGERLKGEY
ncbi:MAG: mechanosensitive ion channel family protein [Thermoplasmata archaeon]|nr:mechanosensitive ion channel family protein [Thermoplasmata archaeon]